MNFCHVVSIERSHDSRLAIILRLLLRAEPALQMNDFLKIFYHSELAGADMEISNAAYCPFDVTSHIGILLVYVTYNLAR